MREGIFNWGEMVLACPEWADTKGICKHYIDGRSAP